MIKTISHLSVGVAIGYQANQMIACDLFLDLEMYSIPQSYLNEVKEKFPLFEFCEINTPNAKKIDKDKIEIYWGNRISLKVLHDLPNLEWIHLGSVGVSHEVFLEAKRRSIKITNSADIMTNAVAASGLAFMFGLARGFHSSMQLKQKKELNRKSFDMHFNNIQDVFNQSVLIAGHGDIGKKIYQHCLNLDMNVSIIRKKKNIDIKGVEHIYSLDEIEKAVKDADYVINILPLNDKTEKIFSKNVFIKMKKTAFFINIGRGDTVIESDLVDALKNNEIAGAGLDVFSSASYVDPYHPLKNDSPLLNLNNVILTPHVAGMTQQYWKNQSKLFQENLNNFINNQPLKNRID